MWTSPVIISLCKRWEITDTYSVISSMWGNIVTFKTSSKFPPIEAATFYQIPYKYPSFAHIWSSGHNIDRRIISVIYFYLKGFLVSYLATTEYAWIVPSVLYTPNLIAHSRQRNDNVLSTWDRELLLDCSNLSTFAESNGHVLRLHCFVAGRS